jgi:NADPH:quinone reductase-like Zn-dependent oxidoreductase
MIALGAFAERVVLPARSAVKIPAGVPLSEAALVVARHSRALARSGTSRRSSRETEPS